MRQLNDIIECAPFTLVAAVIHKSRLIDRYRYPQSPYDLALVFCVERLAAFLKERLQEGLLTHIVVERRGKNEDDELELAFRRMRGGQNASGSAVLLDLMFADKKSNSAGLQLADLTARPVGRHVMEPRQPNRAWEIIEKKLRRSPAGVYSGWGLKVFP